MQNTTGTKNNLDLGYDTQLYVVRSISHKNTSRVELLGYDKNKGKFDRFTKRNAISGQNAPGGMVWMKTIDVLRNEYECVKRNIAGCDRRCGGCKLVLPDDVILHAYEECIAVMDKLTDLVNFEKVKCELDKEIVDDRT